MGVYAGGSTMLLLDIVCFRRTNWFRCRRNDAGRRRCRSLRYVRSVLLRFRRIEIQRGVRFIVRCLVRQAIFLVRWCC
jgi:hypothetical protein